MNRGPAIWATAVALALVNIGIATLIVSAMGSSVVAPLWVGLACVVLGAASAAGAVVLWRQYLAEARGL